MSLRRTAEPFKMYSFCPSRCTTRSIRISSKSNGNTFLLLSSTMVTPARLPRATVDDPPQIKSSPRLPRIDLTDCSPSTKRKDSATLLLPEPFCPTIALMGAENSSSPFLANDLNPAIVSSLRYMTTSLITSSQHQHYRPRRYWLAQ